MRNLYENYTNYIYKIESTHDIFELEDERYLLFNPSIFKWMSIDAIGLELINEIKEKHSVEDVKKHIMKKYDISEEIFENDAMPFICTLFDEKYFIESMDTKGVLEAPWMKKNVTFSQVDGYVFSDIYIRLSEVCNLRCQYCFNEKKRGKQKKEEYLNIDRIRKVLKEFKKFEGKRVVFTGGEPTLNQDFIELCKIAKEIGLKVAVITNGTLLEQYEVEDVVECIDELSISIDSVNDCVQQQLWNVDTFSYTENVKPFLNRLNEYVSKKKINYEVNIMPVISKMNVDMLIDLFNEINLILHSCNVTWKISRFAKIESKVINELLSIQRNEFDSAIWGTMKNNVDYRTITEFILSKGGKEILDNKPHFYTCLPSFFITYYGDVYPCQGLENDEYILGNIKEQNLENIFYSEKFKCLLEKLKVNNTTHCNMCELRMYCNNIIDKPCNIEVEHNCKQDIIFRMYMSTLRGKNGKEYRIKDL